MLDLRRFDLLAWATYTDTQKVAMLLGSIPPKLDRQHEKAWVLLTSPTCTQLIYLIQSHSRLTQLPVLPSTSLPATILSSPSPDDIHCQVCQSPFDEHKGIGPCGPVPPPPLEWTSFPPLVTSVSITPKSAESVVV